jgi:hypothetical protein
MAYMPCCCLPPIGRNNRGRCVHPVPGRPLQGSFHHPRTRYLSFMAFDDDEDMLIKMSSLQAPICASLCLLNVCCNYGTMVSILFIQLSTNSLSSFEIVLCKTPIQRCCRSPFVFSREAGKHFQVSGYLYMRALISNRTHVPKNRWLACSFHHR